MRLKTLTPFGLAILGCIFLGCSVEPSSSGSGGSGGAAGSGGAGGSAGSGGSAGAGGGGEGSDCATVCTLLIDCGVSDDNQADCEAGCAQAQANRLAADFNEGLDCLDEHLIVGECDVDGFEACLDQVNTCQQACLRLVDCGALDMQEASVENCTRNGPVCDAIAECTAGCEEELAEAAGEVMQVFECINEHLAQQECNNDALNDCVPFFTGVLDCDDACSEIIACGFGDDTLEECIAECSEAEVENPEQVFGMFACIEEHVADGVCDDAGYVSCAPEPMD